MADRVPPHKRSQIMAKIRSEGNRSTELALASLFRRAGIKGWRRHVPLPGKPDFAFPRLRVAVFVDGCFWHGHKHRCRLPSANRAYWSRKIERNRARDQAVNKVLRDMGWRVIRIWEHLVPRPRTVMRIKRHLH